MKAMIETVALLCETVVLPMQAAAEPAAAEQVDSREPEPVAKSRGFLTVARERDDAKLVVATDAARLQLRKDAGFGALAAAYERAAQVYHDAPPAWYGDVARQQRRDVVWAAYDAYWAAREAIVQRLRGRCSAAEAAFEAVADVPEDGPPTDWPAVWRAGEQMSAAFRALSAMSSVASEPNGRANGLVKQHDAREDAWREAEWARMVELDRVPECDEGDSGTEMDSEHASAWLKAECPWVKWKEFRVKRHGRIPGVTDGRLSVFYRKRGESSFTREDVGGWSSFTRGESGPAPAFVLPGSRSRLSTRHTARE